MGLDVLLQVLRTLEGFAAKIAFVRFQRHMDSDVRRDVVAFDGGGPATAPLAGQVEIIRALATDMAFAHMFLQNV